MASGGKAGKPNERLGSNTASLRNSQTHTFQTREWLTGQRVLIKDRSLDGWVERSQQVGV